MEQHLAQMPSERNNWISFWKFLERSSYFVTNSRETDQLFFDVFPPVDLGPHESTDGFIWEVSRAWTLDLPTPQFLVGCCLDCFGGFGIVLLQFAGILWHLLFLGVHVDMRFAVKTDC